MNARWLILAGIGLLVLLASIMEARKPTISEREARIFHALNGLPDSLFPVCWLPMQLGNLVVGALVGYVIAFLAGSLATAVGVTLAVVLKIVTERVIRKEMAAYLAVRQRPGTSQVGAVLRGDVPSTGPSFPSGHVILISAIGSVVAPRLDATLLPIPIVLTMLVMFGRIYVGAHNPLDVTAGVGAGLLLGGVLAAFVR